MSLPEGCTRLADRLRHYTPALAGVSRALFDARSRQAVRFAAKSAPSAPTRGATQAAQAAGAVRVRIGSAEGELCVGVDVSRHAALQAIALEPDGQRRAALANLWLAGALEMLSTHGVAQPEVRDISFGAEAQDDTRRTAALAVEYEHAGTAHTVTLLEAPGALARALERRVASMRLRERVTDTAAGSALAGLTVPTRLRLRSRRCSAALLASLQVGDVLLGWPRANGYAHGAPLDHATLLWGAPTGRAASAQACIDARNIILQTIPETMSQDPDLSLASPSQLSCADAPKAVDPVDLSDVELSVHIEVVTVNLTLEQIAALQPGYILTLPLALADSEIRLVAHGQTLALGELVAVGDNLGLQIQHIANSHERHT
ncbi:YscQ/HrcQ family type III secretion apparatus protein [bacterium M00.F.Ca.ET.228.01.1.1]|nr:YscQ/HrcQ family type III secretion apparatus protein [bacterium M00.F.Ca.ET.228.01.1.1]TGR98181.1 YscQ/HrcQ family type III secretion apparatus protein [bacterium M00.F.Ca.ET.191.01.1.1]TGU02372.1 YscQ/HrcQ family type III secretion apparatus protein [bacterium M00.F.Ca.ET.155.01.1.1]